MENGKDLKLNSNAYLPLRDVVFQTLRTAILRGELKPGERLMELQLADQLGVSRTPVREAIRMLEQEGLAVTTPRKGAQVARMTEKDMEEVLQIRTALEELAARLSCGRITEKELEELHAAMENFEQKTENGNLEEMGGADSAFHDVIYRASGNQKLLNLLNNLREQIYRYRIEYLKDSSSYPVLIREHREIYEALQLRDGEKAAEKVRIHLKNQEEVMTRMIREQG